MSTAMKLIEAENIKIQRELADKVSGRELERIMQPTNVLLQQIRDVLYGDENNVGHVHIMKHYQKQYDEHMKKYHGEPHV